MAGEAIRLFHMGFKQQLPLSSSAIKGIRGRVAISCSIPDWATRRRQRESCIQQLGTLYDSALGLRKDGEADAKTCGGTVSSKAVLLFSATRRGLGFHGRLRRGWGETRGSARAISLQLKLLCLLRFSFIIACATASSGLMDWCFLCLRLWWWPLYGSRECCASHFTLLYPDFS